VNNKSKYSLIVAFLILISCSVNTLREHYVLSYLPDPAQAEKFKAVNIPFDYRVEVQNFEMNRIYDRNSIVIRESLHKLSYDRKNEWALRPDKGIPELLVSHINSLYLFKECKTNFLTDNPDYYISGMISNLEIYQSEIATFAHVKVFFEFRDSSRNILIRYEIDRKAEMVKPDVPFFIKTVSDILKNETDLFLFKVVEYLKNHPGR
jgi:hypothetical protein